jgi:tetratricopeptide (TPR) repeat protein
MKINNSKKRLFQFILILLPIVILFLFEIILRIAGYGYNFNLFIDNPVKKFREFKICNPDIGKKYFQTFEASSPPHDMILKKKPANGFRIFVLGSSTVAGFPYDENLMFSRILYERLQDSYPGKKIEIMNTSLTAINSYTFLDDMDDILKEKPDAILFYEGHNEFYGALGVGSNETMSKYRELTLIHLKLMKLRTYQFLRNIVFATGKLFSGTNPSENVFGTLMRRIAGNKEIEYQGEVYKKGIKQFKDNMTDLFEKAKLHQVPVLISEVVSNIHDLEPLSVSSGLKNNEAGEAFQKAKDYESNGEFSNAKRLYYYARDLDGVRFRASEEINDIIHQLAEQYHAYLVPMKSYFEKNSANGLMGNNLFTEHVHPNIDGYFLMADAFYNTVIESKLIGNEIVVYYKTSDYYERNWGYTGLDSTFAVIRVNMLKCLWPFKPFDAPLVDYRKVYKPKSYTDSLALAVIKGGDRNSVIIDAHLKLAKYYKERKEFNKAYKEYYSITKSFPYFSDDYVNAAGCLIRTDDFSSALKLLNTSLELEGTFSGYYLKGEIHTFRNEYQNAIESLQSALKIASGAVEQEKALSKLFEAYYYMKQTEKVKETIKEIQRLNPKYKPVKPRQQVDFRMVVPNQVKAPINEALDQFKKGNVDKALKEFLASLEIKETTLANRYVGEILIKKHDPNALIYLLRAYPDYSTDESYLNDLCMMQVYYKMTGEAAKTLNTIRQINPVSKYIPVLEQFIAKFR